MADLFHAGLMASFDVETLMCDLFRVAADDPSLSTGSQDAGSQGMPAPDLTAMLTHAHASLGEDFLALEPYPAGLDPATQARIFHERVHYWQVISTPMRQLAFLYSLAQLGHGVEALGGRRGLIAGRDTAQAASVTDLVDDERLTFLPFSVDPSMVRSINSVDYGLTTEMAFYLREVGTSGYPGYAALMQLPEGAAWFPFSGLALAECSAYVAERLLSGQEVPRMVTTPSLGDRQDLYLGPWEFWARLHGHRYRDPRDLAQAFLVVADVALVTDAIDTEIKDSESWPEERHYSYRFGKLVFRMRDHEPFILGDRDPHAATAEFYSYVCRYAGGLPHVRRSVMKAMVALTLEIVVTLDRFGVRAWDEEWIIERMIRRSPQQVAEDDWDGLLQQLGTIDAFMAGHPLPVPGLATLRAMVNACQVRLELPGSFALPHLYADELGRRLPLPMILLAGRYHRDRFSLASPPDPRPLMTLRPFEMAFEAMVFTCLRPLRHARTTCGFIENLSPCHYTLTGLGCTVRGFSEQEWRARRALGIDETCHWTNQLARLGIPRPPR